MPTSSASVAEVDDAVGVEMGVAVERHDDVGTGARLDRRVMRGCRSLAVHGLELHLDAERLLGLRHHLACRTSGRLRERNRPTSTNGRSSAGHRPACGRSPGCRPCRPGAVPPASLSTLRRFVFAISCPSQDRPPHLERLVCGSHRRRCGRSGASRLAKNPLGGTGRDACSASVFCVFGDHLRHAAEDRPHGIVRLEVAGSSVNSSLARPTPRSAIAADRHQVDAFGRPAARRRRSRRSASADRPSGTSRRCGWPR